jgi:hypothetical protein
MMEKDLELRVMEALERLEQVGCQLEMLKANLSTGAPLSPSQPPSEWSVLRERIARLTENNEATHSLAKQIRRLAMNMSQRVTKLEEQNGKQ